MAKTIIHLCIEHGLLVFDLLKKWEYLHRLLDREYMLETLGRQDPEARYPDLWWSMLILHYFYYWCCTHDWDSIFSAMITGWRSCLADFVLNACHYVLLNFLNVGAHRILRDSPNNRDIPQTVYGYNNLTKDEVFPAQMPGLFLLRPVHLFGGFILHLFMTSIEWLLPASRKESLLAI